MRVAASVAAMAAVTYGLTELIPVNPTTAGFAYFLTVLVIATTWGLLESVVASLAATLCFNFFFFPPVGTFSIADPHNWVALFAFLATALIASQLSERARQRTREAVRRRREVERLYALSRAILLTDCTPAFAQQIAKEIARIYELSAVTLFDSRSAKIYAAGRESLPGLAERLRGATLGKEVTRDPQTQVTITPIGLGVQPIGALGLKGAELGEEELKSLANLVAFGVERAQAQETAARAEAARHSEELKSTLLDALAHEFKTPLTSIQTASSAILSSGVTEPEPQRELLTVIDEEAGRLSRLVTEALHLARIQAGRVYLNKEPQPVGGLLETLRRQMEPALQGRRLEVSLGEDLPEVFVDAELAEVAVRNLIDNAVKYSPPASTIRVRVAWTGEAVLIRVHNQGPALSDADRERIFEKFYRGAEAGKQAPGAGMGLAIAREIALAHGGDLRVESPLEGGVEFVISFPVAGKVLRTWPTVTY